jgi:hypothetical protein
MRLGDYRFILGLLITALIWIEKGIYGMRVEFPPHHLSGGNFRLSSHCRGWRLNFFILFRKEPNYGKQ